MEANQLPTLTFFYVRFTYAFLWVRGCWVKIICFIIFEGKWRLIPWKFFHIFVCSWCNFKLLFLFWSTLMWIKLYMDNMQVPSILGVNLSDVDLFEFLHQVIHGSLLTKTFPSYFLFPSYLGGKGIQFLALVCIYNM